MSLLPNELPDDDERPVDDDASGIAPFDLTGETDEADALEQSLELGYDDEHDHA